MKRNRVVNIMKTSRFKKIMKIIAFVLLHIVVAGLFAITWHICGFLNNHGIYVSNVMRGTLCLVSLIPINVLICIEGIKNKMRPEEVAKIATGSFIYNNTIYFMESPDQNSDYNNGL